MTKCHQGFNFAPLHSLSMYSVGVVNWSQLPLLNFIWVSDVFCCFCAYDSCVEVHMVATLMKILAHQSLGMSLQMQLTSGQFHHFHSPENWFIQKKLIWNEQMNGLVNAKKVAWCKGKNTPLPLLWLEFDSHTWGHMWIEFVVGSRVSPQVLRFSFLYKDQHFKFQFELETADKKSHPVECPLLHPVYYLFIYYRD